MRLTITSLAFLLKMAKRRVIQIIHFHTSFEAQSAFGILLSFRPSC